MLGYAVGLGIAFACGGLAWRAVVRMQRRFDDWRVAFRLALDDAASDAQRATRVDELLGDLERDLDTDAFLSGAAVRLAVVGGAACGLAFGLGGAWREGLGVLPGAAFGALVAARLGRVRATRSAAIRDGVSGIVEREASGLLVQTVTHALRPRRTPFGKR